MLSNLLTVLGSNNWYWTNDELIHIAKGKYELPLTRKERMKKRKLNWIMYINRLRVSKIIKKMNTK